MSEQVEINILGHSLVVKCQGGDAPVREAAALLEETVDEVRKHTGTIDSARLLLYAAFKLAGKNVELKKQLVEIGDKIESIDSDLAEII